MPLLSIILVNYKVPHFLSACLYSVRRASADMDVEVIVVDNHSEDGSIARLSPLFPAVRFIQASENLGFAKASNWGYRASTGEFVLFLNPDTILSEHSLRESINFLRSNPQAGALGIRMIDGGGCFLRESKRAFPDPSTALYKMIGLSNGFPRSKRFARYYLGNLPDNQHHVIDVVCGAYFMVRRVVLEQVGAFDESFFMYGEDIDLSHRIQQAGYRNYYFSGATILHFKGESTSKHSTRYVKNFYGAMSQFVQKHYAGNSLFITGLQIGIFLSATLAFFRRFLSIQSLGNLSTSTMRFPVIIIGSEQNRHFIECHYSGMPAASFLPIEPDWTIDNITECARGYISQAHPKVVVFSLEDVSHQTMFSLMEHWGRRFIYGFYTPQSNLILPFQND